MSNRYGFHLLECVIALMLGSALRRWLVEGEPNATSSLKSE